MTKLDSMRWFSHWCRTGGRHNCITYLLMDIVVWPTATHAMLKMFSQTYKYIRRTQGPRGPHPRRPLPKKMLHFVVFFVTADLDLWHLTPKIRTHTCPHSSQTRVQNFTPLTFSATEKYVTVQTNKKKQKTHSKLSSPIVPYGEITNTAENIHLVPLCYASG